MFFARRNGRALSCLTARDCGLPKLNYQGLAVDTAEDHQKARELIK